MVTTSMVNFHWISCDTILFITASTKAKLKILDRFATAVAVVIDYRLNVNTIAARQMANNISIVDTVKRVLRTHDITGQK